MTDYLAVLTTTDSAVAAAVLARSAVSARLAACAQVDGPVTSTYWWQGAVETAEEWRITFKTTAERYPALEAHVKAAHSYDTPELVATPITAGSAEYLAWLSAAVAP
ncbi:divalent-cation tolerance protein CutA [Kitasatospora sp. NPDC050543]|uniref:divalent-cation tolerance protein CutA n=1 Tax=Kitasatospora sp. NPDC050543 TaxID=3364054 RepID=UPI0037B67D37